jgi:hypothetical protein
LLQRGDLKAETVSQIVAAQDQAVQTKYDAIKVLKRERQLMQTMPIF